MCFMGLSGWQLLGSVENLFRFWRKRHRARCEAQGTECIPRDTRLTEEQRRWSGAAPPRRAGGLWLAGPADAGLLFAHTPLRVCSLVAPRQRAKSPPANFVSFRGTAVGSMRNADVVYVRQVGRDVTCAFDVPTTSCLLECELRGQSLGSLFQHQHGAVLVFLAQ